MPPDSVVAIRITLTWPAAMDTTSTPANESWTAHHDEFPIDIATQTWQSPTELRLVTDLVPIERAVFLSYAGGDPGLKTGHGDVVEAFDLGEIDACL